jgi:tRNA (mo5U34)-methyltransferase
MQRRVLQHRNETTRCRTSRLSVYDLHQLGERFDLVLFLGVFYHLRHPLLALDLIHQHVARDLLVFQSLQRGAEEVATVEENYEFSEVSIFERLGFPKLYFIEKQYVGDPTNWWIPNRACVEAMLRSSGFEILDRPETEVFVCKHQPTKEIETFIPTGRLES